MKQRCDNKETIVSSEFSINAACFIVYKLLSSILDCNLLFPPLAPLLHRSNQTAFFSFLHPILPSAFSFFFPKPKKYRFRKVAPFIIKARQVLQRTTDLRESDQISTALRHIVKNPSLLGLHYLRYYKDRKLASCF